MNYTGVIVNFFLNPFNFLQQFSFN